MRVLEYRQNLDAYEIHSSDLHIASIEINSPDQDPDITQIDRLIALAQSDPCLNTDLVNYRFEKVKNLVKLVAIIYQQAFTLNLLSVEIKACSIKLRYHL